MKIHVTDLFNESCESFGTVVRLRAVGNIRYICTIHQYYNTLKTRQRSFTQAECSFYALVLVH